MLVPVLLVKLPHLTAAKLEHTEKTRTGKDTTEYQLEVRANHKV